jgi:hypothetical protein
VIDSLHQILRDLLASRVARVAGASQIGFEPPNTRWQTDVVATAEERVNLYLYDTKENTDLRSNERVRENVDGWFRESKVPDRLDCYYLVTTWSPVVPTATVEAAPDEHSMLYEVLAVLMRNRPLTPTHVYSPDFPNPFGRTITSVPPLLQDEVLPMSVALPDGLGNLGEFWNTMGEEWKPALSLTVTVPIFQPDAQEFPAVTSVIGDYRATDADSAERLVTVGGHVFSSATGDPIKGAWVRVQGSAPPSTLGANLRYITREDGRFAFSRLVPGTYEITAVVTGQPEYRSLVEVPSESGNYDIYFS